MFRSEHLGPQVVDVLVDLPGAGVLADAAQVQGQVVGGGQGPGMGVVEDLAEPLVGLGRHLDRPRVVPQQTEVDGQAAGGHVRVRVLGSQHRPLAFQGELVQFLRLHVTPAGAQDVGEVEAEVEVLQIAFAQLLLPDLPQFVAQRMRRS